MSKGHLQEGNLKTCQNKNVNLAANKEAMVIPTLLETVSSKHCIMSLILSTRSRTLLKHIGHGKRLPSRMTSEEIVTMRTIGKMLTSFIYCVVFYSHILQ